MCLQWQYYGIELISERVMCSLTLILFTIYVQQAVCTYENCDKKKFNCEFFQSHPIFFGSASFNESCYFYVIQTKQLKNIHKTRSVFACENHMNRYYYPFWVFFLCFAARAHVCNRAAVSKVDVLIKDRFIHQEMCATLHLYSIQKKKHI